MPPNAERKAYQEMQNLIDRKEEKARHDSHQQDETRGDHRFASARPNDLRSLGAYLLDKLKRIGHDTVPRAKRRPLKISTAAGQKDLRRGTFRPRATESSYRIARRDAKGILLAGVALARSYTQNARLFLFFCGNAL